MLPLLCLTTVASTGCDEGNSIRIEAGHTYFNPEYDYSLVIPKGAAGCASGPPSPNHGVAIIVDSAWNIWVDGSYNVTGFKSAREALARDIKYVQSDHPSAKVVKIRWSKTIMGHLPAEEVTVTLSIGTGKEVKEMRAVVIRPDFNGVETGIVYTVGLTASAADFERAKAYADGLLRGIIFHQFRDDR